MIKTIIVIIIVATCIPVHGQQIVETVFYKNEFKLKAVSEKRANFVYTKTIENDGSICHEFRNTKTKKIFYYRCFQDSVPVGIWIDRNQKKSDYTFNLVYAKNEFQGIPKYDPWKGQMTDTLEKIVPPSFEHNKNNFLEYFQYHLDYPDFIVENGISGKVIIQFIIDENGNISDVEILKGAHPCLDKEAARLFIESPRWIPAKKEGRAINSYVVFPVNYILQ